MELHSTNPQSEIVCSLVQCEKIPPEQRLLLVGPPILVMNFPSSYLAVVGIQEEGRERDRTLFN